MATFNDLSGKTVVITGAARGIGEAMARAFSENSAKLVLVDIDKAGIETVAANLAAQGMQAIALQADVSDHASALKVAADAAAKFGSIDVLINNAGITRDAMLPKLTEEKWDEVIRVNLKGPFNLGQACAAKMGNGSSIINISSVAWLGNIGQTNYSASKAGVIGLTRTWAVELARQGVRVNAIAPGFIDSALTQKIPADIKEKFVQKIPLKRIGETREIAQVALFLASSVSSYLTGQVIHVDGGLTVGLSGI